MKKLGRSTLTLGALSLGVLALGSANAATVIRIASMSPLTGSSSDLGLQIRNATELAIKDNKSAFTALGFDLQFVAYDDQADPTTGTATLELTGLCEQGAVAVDVVNVLGQVVRHLSSRPSQGVLRENLDLQDLPTGVYLVRVHAQEGLVVKRLVRE